MQKQEIKHEKKEIRGYQQFCSVNNATLNRFFALHFVLPFVLAALALMHLIALHDSAGSGNPLGVSGNYDRLPFAPYFTFKDLITIFIFILILSMFVFFMPNLLGDSENYVMANPMQTPPAIVPEWYLLPFYAILRSIPNKLLGVIAMFSAILILLVMPFTDLSRSRGIQFKPLSKAAFFIFVGNFLILMELGAKHVESPFIEFGQISTVIYFAHFLIIVPLISLFENSLIELSMKGNKNGYLPWHPHMENTIVLSGWWEGQSLDVLFNVFKKPYTGKIVTWKNKTGYSEIDLIAEKMRYWASPTIEVAYDRKIEAWVRADGLVSPDAPLPINEYGNLRPFKWITVEQHLKDKGLSIEHYKKTRGLDDESIKEYEEAKKQFKVELRKHNEEVKKKREQQQKEDDETDRKNGRPGDDGLGSPVVWKDKDGNEHRPASHKRNKLIINLEPYILTFNKYSIYTLFAVLCGVSLTVLPFSMYTEFLTLLHSSNNTDSLTLLHSSNNTDSLTAAPLHCDAPRPWGIYFQDSATPQMEGLVELHDNILFYLVIILFGVGWLLVSIVKNYTNTESPISHKYLSHGTLIELIWTITPALILILIAFPSFKLLYLMDEVSDPAMAVLAEGFFMGGLKLHILNKIKDTSLTVCSEASPMSNRTGEKYNILVPRLAQVQNTSFLLQLPNMSITRYTKQNITLLLF